MYKQNVDKVVVTQTVLGGLTFILQRLISCSAYVPKIMKVGWQLTKLLQLQLPNNQAIFWPTRVVFFRHACYNKRTVTIIYCYYLLITPKQPTNIQTYNRNQAGPHNRTDA